MDSDRAQLRATAEKALRASAGYGPAYVDKLARAVLSLTEPASAATEPTQWWSYCQVHHTRHACIHTYLISGPEPTCAKCGRPTKDDGWCSGCGLHDCCCDPLPGPAPGSDRAFEEWWRAWRSELRGEPRVIDQARAAWNAALRSARPVVAESALEEKDRLCEKCATRIPASANPCPACPPLCEHVMAEPPVPCPTTVREEPDEDDMDPWGSD